MDSTPADTHASLTLSLFLSPPSLSLSQTHMHTHTHTHTHHSKSNDIIHRKDGGSTGLTYRGRIWTNESSRQFLMQWLILLPRFVFQCNWHCMVATDIEKIMHNNYALCTSGVHVIFCSVLHLNMSHLNMCTLCVHVYRASVNKQMCFSDALQSKMIDYNYRWYLP